MPLFILVFALFGRLFVYLYYRLVGPVGGHRGGVARPSDAAPRAGQRVPEPSQHHHHRRGALRLFRVVLSMLLNVNYRMGLYYGWYSNFYCDYCLQFFASG